MLNGPRADGPKLTGRPVPATGRKWSTKTGPQLLRYEAPDGVLKSSFYRSKSSLLRPNQYMFDEDTDSKSRFGRLPEVEIQRKIPFWKAEGLRNPISKESAPENGF